MTFKVESGEMYLCFLHDGACASVHRRRSPPHLRGTVHRQRLAVNVLLLSAGSLHRNQMKNIATIQMKGHKNGINVHFGDLHALMGGLVSTGAPSVPPARLFFRFSWTWVSRSSRSTLSASLARQASSSWFARLVRKDFLLSTSQKHTYT